MDIVKDFSNLKGWITYTLCYDDGSSSIEQFTFEDFYNFRYYLGEFFKKKLKKEYNYDDIVLEEIHIQDKENKFNIHMNDTIFTARCYNEINSELIDKNYIKKLNNIKENIDKAKTYLDSIENIIK